MRREGGTLLNECARGNFDDGNRLGNTWRVPDHILAEEKGNMVMVLDVVGGRGGCVVQGGVGKGVVWCGVVIVMIVVRQLEMRSSASTVSSPPLPFSYLFLYFTMSKLFC